MNTKTTFYSSKYFTYTICSLICILLTTSLLIYFTTSGKTKYSREYLLRKEYPNAIICTELIFDKNGTNIAHGFLTENKEFGIAVFEQTNYKNFKLADHLISPNNDILIIETMIGKREYYVFSIDQKGIHSATMKFLFNNGTSTDFKNINIKSREICVIIKPQIAHKIIITYN